MNSIAANAGLAPLPTPADASAGAVPAVRRARWQVRILSALVLAPPVLLAVYLGSPWFELLLAVAAALMALEWTRLTLTASQGVVMAVVVATSLAAILAAFAGTPMLGLAAIALGAVIAGGYAYSSRDPNAVWAIPGVLYIALPCLAAAWLRELPQGREILFWVLPTIWASDIAAYAIGSAVGGPKLAPRVSPGKTWAGAVGGVSGAAMVSAAVGTWFGLGGALGMTLLGVAASIVGQIGDLMKSTVKRRFGVKDMGRLIPGHGGVLDRLDALLTVFPFVAALVWLAGERMPSW